MTCPQARELLDAYFDGELELARSFEVEQHLARCLICRSLQERNQKVRRVMQSRDLYRKAPSDLKERIVAPYRALREQ